MEVPTATCGLGRDDRQLLARLGEQALIAWITRLRLVGIRVDRADRGRSHWKLEAFDLAVAELDGPHDCGVGTHGNHRSAHRNPVGEGTHLDRLLRAGLDAALALPALVGGL